MDFDRMLKNDMDALAERVEAGFEEKEIDNSVSSEELEMVVRRIVKEELYVALKEVEKIVDKCIGKHMKNESQNNNINAFDSKNTSTVIPKIDIKPSVSYNIKSEASGGMTCGGWTFFANRKEGKHLWAVNDKGTEYCELYPKTISHVEKIEDGFVYFADTDFNRFKVNLSSGKVEKTSR